MSVGHYSENGTVHWLEKIKAPRENYWVCLPKQFDRFEESYKENGVQVYVYDESKYINKDFEYFGFKPRNCGGVGRQGIAEAVENLCKGEDVIFYQMDDDTTSIGVRDVVNKKGKTVQKWSSIMTMVNAFNRAEEEFGCDFAARTGATPPHGNQTISSRKIFNNFIMKRGNEQNFKGFRAFCSDDYRFGYYENLINCRPTISLENFCISFTASQGMRNDGNSVIYNGDCSWKKSFALKMMFPWAVQQKIVFEGNKYLFREQIEQSKLYTNISLIDKDGKITDSERIF